MSRTDLISDAFTIIRNALKAKREEAYIAYSNSLLKICEILKQEGYLENFKMIELKNVKRIKVYLKYDGKQSVIRHIGKVSSPGRRVYVRQRDIPIALNGYGITLVSTSKGICTDKEAREKGIGGEILGMVW
jgi:small subunit ribosomal protein S8